jgi:integrase/recombinase XerD
MMALRGQLKHKEPLFDMTDPEGMGQLAEGYYTWQQLKGYSEVTVYNTRKNLEYFGRWLLQRDIHKPIKLTRPIIERYQKHLFHHRKTDGLPLSFCSIKQRLVIVRGFFGWLTRKGYIPANPAADIDLPKEEKRLPGNLLTAEEVEKIMALPDLDTPAGIRDRTILEVLYSTGIRRAELTRLKITDVDLKWQSMHIRDGKGRKDRMLPLGERAAAWLNKYLLESRVYYATDPDDQWLFLTRDATPLTCVWLGSLVRKYITTAEIEKRGSCHMFRHSMATLMLEGGADIRYIQQMLGHATINSTQVYTKVSLKTLREVHSKTHPAARLKPEKKA